MPEPISANYPSEDSISDNLDWPKLARELKLSSQEEAKKRAYEIAEFVARVENDEGSKLILKTGGKSLELTLNR